MPDGKSLLKDAAYVPPPIPEMNNCLDKFEKYLHADDSNPPLIRLALIHYQFEAIHPFLDGNGRIGRLLISLLLVHWKILSLPLLYLSEFFEKHRQDYYDLLLAVSEHGAWADWIDFFLRGVSEQSNSAISQAKQLEELHQEWYKRLEAPRASTLLFRLADSLFEIPFITIPIAKTILGVSYPGAKYNVEKLVKAGILKQINDTSYNRLFVAKEILDIIG